MSDTIREILSESAEKNRDITAIRWLEHREVRDITYGELKEHVEKLRRALLKRGYRGRHLALVGAGSLSWVSAYLAIVTGPMCAVPVDVNLPQEDQIDILNRSDSEAVFLAPNLSDLEAKIRTSCPEIREIFVLTEDAGIPNSTASLRAEAEKSIPSAADPGEESRKSAGGKTSAGAESSPTGDTDEAPAAEDLATIIYTSGTTGKSKGVCLTQKNLASNCLSVRVHSHPGLVLLSVLPIHHAFCLVMDWLQGLHCGATIVINDSLLHMLKNMQRFQPEIMLMVPLMIETIWKKISSLDPSLPPKKVKEAVFGKNLRVIYAGGAHLDPYYIEKFARYGVDIFEGYGMSECSPVISQNIEEAHRPGSVGKPICNAQVKIENGEVLVKGTSVMREYYRMPEETAETLKNGWLHTGDEGYIDEDGYLYITGRSKNLIILSNGENISPEEMESKISVNPLVGEIIITGEKNGLTARIYPDPDVTGAKKMDGESIRTALQAVIDDFNRAQPTWRHITGLIVRRHPFIKNSTHKIIRSKSEIDE